MHTLTVIIPCKDELGNIVDCVDSVRPIAHEILIADSGSRDGTLDLVRAMPDCRLVCREYIHYGDFLNWAIPQAAHPWVLVVDADERVDAELANAVRQLLQGKPRCDGYTIRRHNYFMGQRIRFGGWGGDRVLRLFRRDAGRYLGETDHARIDLTNVGRLAGTLRHYSVRSYQQYLAKLDRYTSVQARQWHKQARRPCLLRMLCSGPLRFVHTYVFRLGFLDGLAGIQICALTGLASFLKQARLWEHVRGTGEAWARPSDGLR